MKTKPITVFDIAKNRHSHQDTMTQGQPEKQSTPHARPTMTYGSNTFAINLRQNKSNTIGIIVPKINSHFISLVIAGVEKVMNSAGYNLLICESLEDINKEIINVKTMFDNQVAGLLVSLAANTDDLSHFNTIKKLGTPVIFFDRAPIKSDNPAIIINNELAAYDITRHLIEQGATNIVHITGNQMSNVYKNRTAGYIRALKEAQIPFTPSNIITNDLSAKSGIKAAHRIVELDADGVFAANDYCAASCMHELKRKGRRIPGDILFAGFNNDMIAGIIDPSLTTIDYPGFQMGEMAARQLLAYIEDSVEANQSADIFIKTSLVIRKSSLRKSVTG